MSYRKVNGKVIFTIKSLGIIGFRAGKDLKDYLVQLLHFGYENTENHRN